MSCLPGGAASCPGLSVHGAGLWSTELQLDGRGRREAGAVLTHSCHRNRTMELFCARATNRKQSLIINSARSFSVPGGSEQLASACDLATAGVSISYTTDRKRTVTNSYADVTIYLTLRGTLVTHTALFFKHTSSILPSITLTMA